MEFDINIYDTYFTLKWYQLLFVLSVILIFLYGFITIILKLIRIVRGLTSQWLSK